MIVRAPELSGTVGAAGALDIMAERLATPLACRAGTRTAVRLSSSGQSVQQAHLTLMAERQETLPAFREGT
jgi:hypothetical protein